MSVIINDKVFEAEYLSRPEELKRGMMGRESLEGCLVFKMGKGYHSFWMKDCKIPLDIVFVLNGRISRIHQKCEPCDGECPHHYTGLGDHVIEFPAGTTDGWRFNDKVKMYMGAPQNPVQG